MRIIIIRSLIVVAAISLPMASSTYSQSVQISQPVSGASEDSEQLRSDKSMLLSELFALESKARKLDKPLARASASAEIADAAWILDREWSKKLLRDGFELTFPSEEEQSKLRKRAVGSAPTLFSSNEGAASSIRNRILEIASRDKLFKDELTQLSEKTLGKLEANLQYTDLAAKSIATGDTEAASDYTLKAIDADPTLLNVGATIFEIAARDRKAADNVIVQYIQRLRSFPISQSNGSALRTYLFLRDLITNNSGTYLALVGKSVNSKDPQLQPPGPMVMKAYVGYVIESLGQLEQREPGSAIRFRGTLLAVWLPLNQYAREFLGPFLQLENLSRRSGEEAALPTVGDKESGVESYEQRVKKALDSDQPDEVTINIAIGRGDLEKARKMIDKLPDGPRKTQLTENLNTQDAIRLAEKGEIGQAATLAERLGTAAAILQVYPVLLKKSLSTSEKWRATPLVYQAIKQLKKADPAPVTTSEGRPETSSTSTGPDLISLSLSRLAKSVITVDETLALAVLDETVIAANKTTVDSSELRLGFDLDVFRQLAPKNETRVDQAAEALTDQFRQVVASAAIKQWKALELENRSKVEASKKKSPIVKR